MLASQPILMNASEYEFLGLARCRPGEIPDGFVAIEQYVRFGSQVALVGAF